ncbi:MAG: hypothetical protein HY781_12160 [Chloroflexi bacterium]|nr:hypothetical protein [Chloroflexota bacterium]
MTVSKGLNPQLEKQLDRLKTIPARDPQTAAQGRARFLTEAAAFRPALVQKERTVVSRRFVWKFALAALAALVLFFGSSVGAAFAARGALPGETLYPVKLICEDLRLGFTGDPQVRIDLLMQFSAVRVSEMNQLAEQSNAIPAETAERLESQIQQALKLAAGLVDKDMLAALTRIRTQLEVQVLSLTQISGEAGDLILQTHLMLQERLRLVDEGLADPEAFRTQVHYSQDSEAASPSPVSSITPEPTAGQGSNSTPGGPDQTSGPQQPPEKTPGPTNESGPPATPGDGGSGNDGGSGGNQP